MHETCAPQVGVCDRRPLIYRFAGFRFSRCADERLVGPVLEGLKDKTAPEYQHSNVPCEPLPLDVYLLGNMVRKRFLEVNFA